MLEAFGTVAGTTTSSFLGFWSSAIFAFEGSFVAGVAGVVGLLLLDFFFFSFGDAIVVVIVWKADDVGSSLGYRSAFMPNIWSHGRQF